jgi:hypothetical protein
VEVLPFREKPPGKHFLPYLGRFDAYPGSRIQLSSHVSSVTYESEPEDRSTGKIWTTGQDLWQNLSQSDLLSSQEARTEANRWTGFASQSWSKTLANHRSKTRKAIMATKAMMAFLVLLLCQPF